MNSQDAFELTYRTGVSSSELERIISKDCHYVYCYAYYILKGRFELGEVAIIKDCHYSWSYAINVLKGRFKLGEKRIVKYFNYSYEYLVKVMGYNHE